MRTPDLDLRLVELPADDDAEQRDWSNAVASGFNSKTQTDTQWAKQAEYYHAEKRRMRGIYHDAPEGALRGPVATFGSYDGSVNTGGGHVEGSNLITDVTVRPSHRRKGLLRRMMTADLTDAKQRGMTFASLTATEATIYGRFGFGAATVHRAIEMDVKRGLSLRTATSGTVESLDPEHPAVIGAWDRLYDDQLRTRRGAHSRAPYYEDMLSGVYDFDEDAPNRKLRAAAHYNTEQQLDGLVAYQIDDWNKVKVIALIGLDANAQLALWDFVGNLDLVEQVKYFGDDPANPLPLALVDSRQYQVTAIKDCIWLRVLDVERALAVRGWEADGDLVLDVEDPMGLSAARVRVSVSSGTAQVSPTEDGADVTLTIETLGSLYFGNVTARALADAGRLSGSEQAITAMNTLFEVSRPPFNQAHF